MDNFKTVEVKSTEWNVSARHIQNLCKTGQIAGAVKKSGIWLIPDSAENPVKRRPKGDNEFDFYGTKRRIFVKSMDLILRYGFESVSMRTIASASGIKQAAIYNHFGSKQEILDTIYGFFSYYLTQNRPRLEEIDPVLQNGTLMDILSSAVYEFDEEYRAELVKAIRIIFQRVGIDKTANELAKRKIVEDGNGFAKAVFDRAVEMGRLAPFDTYAMGVFINGMRIYVFQNWLIDDSPEYSMKVFEDERAVYNSALKLLTDLKPPV